MGLFNGELHYSGKFIEKLYQSHLRSSAYFFHLFPCNFRLVTSISERMFLDDSGSLLN